MENVSIDTSKPVDETIRELIRCATLAPSSHNTQCWKFDIQRKKDDDTITISVIPDFSRACPVVDPDDHHLFVSLGCAVENLIIAGRAHGYETQVDGSHPQDGVHIRLSPTAKTTPPQADALFFAIPKRHVSRCTYDGQSLEQSELQMLQEAATQHDGVAAMFVTDRDAMRNIQEHILRANTDQMSSPEFKRELASWIRFNQMEANHHGDGLSSGATGNPSVPGFLGRAIFNYVVSPSGENKKIVDQVQSSAGFVIFVSESDDPIHWVQAGRCYERFALQATSMNIRTAMLNQPVEETSRRPEFAASLGLKHNSRPDLVVRFGKGGPEMQGTSPRRTLEDVILPNEA